MTCWFISRHPGAARWAVESGIDVSDENVLPEIDLSRIKERDVVIGALPVHVVAELSKRGARYFHLALDVPVWARGREFSSEEMRRYGSRLEEYRALPVESARPSPDLEAPPMESLRSANRAVFAAILKSARIGLSEQRNMDKTFKLSAAGLSSVAGSVATLKGVALAAGPVISTAKIGAVGSMVGGAIGGVVGSGVGIATGGTAIAGTVPLAAAGAAVGAWAGPAMAVFGIGTAPVWAMPMAVIGSVLNAGGLGYLGYRAVSATLRRREAIAMGHDKLASSLRPDSLTSLMGDDPPGPNGRD